MATQRVRGILIVGIVAVAYVLAVHLSMLRAISDPIFQADSDAYLTPVLAKIFNGRWIFNPSRAPGYSLLLYAILAPTRSFLVTLWVQHGMQLATGLAAAVLYYRVFSRSIGYAIAVFFLVSMSPSALLASHMILTETAYTLLATVSMLILFKALSGFHKGLRGWILLGVCVAGTVCIRSNGWAVLAGCLAGILLSRSTLDARKALIGFGLTLACVIGSFGLFNLKQQGFFGLAKFSGVPLIGPTAHLLEIDQVSDQRLRSIWVPIFRDQSAKLHDWDWVRYAPDGPVAAANHAGALGPDPDKTLTHLAYQAIRSHPFRFFWEQIGWLADFIWNRSGIPRIYLSPEYSFFIYHGLAIYARTIADFPQAESFLSIRIDVARPYLSALQQLAHAANETDASRAYSQVQASDIFRYDRVLVLLKPFAWLFKLWRWMALWAIAATVFIWRNRQARTALIVFWVTLGAHILMSNISDPDPRYAIPIEPLYLVLGVAGFEMIAMRWLTAPKNRKVS